MKHTFRFLFCLAALAAFSLISQPASGAVILAGFTEFRAHSTGGTGSPTDMRYSIENTPDMMVTGFVAQVQHARWGDSGADLERLSGGSDHPNWPGGATNDGYARSGNLKPIIFTVTNNSGVNYVLESLLFDAAYAGATVDTGRFNVSYEIAGGSSGLLTPGGVQGPQYPADEIARTYGGFDLPLSSIQLNNGQTIVVTFSVTNSDYSFRLDNLGLDGSVVPEPTTAGLLFAGLTSVLLRRRRARS